MYVWGFGGMGNLFSNVCWKGVKMFEVVGVYFKVIGF